MQSPEILVQWWRLVLPYPPLKGMIWEQFTVWLLNLLMEMQLNHLCEPSLTEHGLSPNTFQYFLPLVTKLSNFWVIGQATEGLQMFFWVFRSKRAMQNTWKENDILSHLFGKLSVNISLIPAPYRKSNIICLKS